MTPYIVDGEPPGNGHGLALATLPLGLDFLADALRDALGPRRTRG